MLGRSRSCSRSRALEVGPSLHRLLASCCIRLLRLQSWHGIACQLLFVLDALNVEARKAVGGDVDSSCGWVTEWGVTHLTA